MTTQAAATGKAAEAPGLPVNRNTDPTRSAFSRVLYLAWPVLIQQALILFVGLYDRWLAGNNPPAEAEHHKTWQAAQTTVQYLNWCISCCAVLVSAGSTALVARFVGAGSREQARHVANQSILLAVFFGVLATIASLSILPLLIQWLELPGLAGDYAKEMLQPVLLLLVFQMVELVGIACLVGAGDTKPSLWILGGVALLNIPLAWACFHGFGPIPEMGYMGITLGTGISHTIGCIAVLIMLHKDRAGLKLRKRLLRPNYEMMRRILRVSVPAAADSLSVAACQLWFLALVNHLGEVAGAAHGIALGLEGLGYLSGQAFAVSAAALVGQNLGARNPREAARCGWTALAMGCACMTLMGVIFYTFARPMFGLFCPTDQQAEIIETGVPVLRLVAFAMPPLAAIIVLTGALRGAGDTRVPMLTTWLGFLVIRIPLAFWFTRETVDLGVLGTVEGWGLGLFGAWLAMFVDLVIRGIIFLWRFRSGRWQKVQV